MNLVEQFSVFSISRLMRLTGWNRSKISNVLTSLKQKQVIVAVKKDSYVVMSKIPESIFKIAVTLVSPSYISFWTGLSYYGFTEQQVKTVQLVSTRQHSPIVFSGQRVETVTFKQEKFFGYQKLEGFCIAEREKLFIDSLYKLENTGGLEEFKKCLRNAWPELDESKLLEYLIMFKNKSLCSRFGYIIEDLSLRTKILNKLQQYRSENYVKLNPQKKVTRDYNKKWRIIVNDQ